MSHARIVVVSEFKAKASCLVAPCDWKVDVRGNADSLMPVEQRAKMSVKGHLFTKHQISSRDAQVEVRRT